MLSATIRSKVDQLWDKFWSGGIANPLTAVEQISYLLFMRRIDAVDRQRTEDAGPVHQDGRGPEAFEDLRAQVSDALRRHGLRTVCRDARCPNVAECWGSIWRICLQTAIAWTRNPPWA